MGRRKERERDPLVFLSSPFPIPLHPPCAFRAKTTGEESGVSFFCKSFKQMTSDNQKTSILTFFQIVIKIAGAKDAVFNYGGREIHYGWTKLTRKYSIEVLVSDLNLENTL